MRELIHNAAIRIVLAVALGIGLSAAASAAAPVREYAARLEVAVKLTRELTEPEEPPPARVVIEKMGAVKLLLPAREEVQLDQQIARVDNGWLHTLIELVVRDANGDVEQRHSMLTEIEVRLTNLLESVNRATTAASAESNDAQARLGAILSRPEYRPELQQESSLRKWAKMLRDAVRRFLRKIFGEPAAREIERRPSSGGSVARVLIALLVVVGLVFGVVKFLRFRRDAAPDEEEAEIREVLGEVIPEDVSASDLLARARELAQRGEFRPAIRRAYLSMLIEMEQRGKLRLHRSKTNRDYLDAMRAETAIYPGFSALTGTYEEIWYGERGATENDFTNFVAKYQETARN
ncbi:MAG: DUF4129 domain-containing protein [Blastocatellia bacterium]|nr:DUF4129 domain-containing protein [Blastocatellia bacterium]